jgi:hypothetical protein
VEGKRSSVGRLLGFVVIAFFLACGIVPIVALSWRMIPNHGLAAVAIVVLVPLFVWGLFKEGDF